MASAGGQDMLSPYQAMGNDPVSLTDPGGKKITILTKVASVPSPNSFSHPIVNLSHPEFGGFTQDAMVDMMGDGDYTSDAFDGLDWGGSAATADYSAAWEAIANQLNATTGTTSPWVLQLSLT